jgi:hypothetical protein
MDERQKQGIDADKQAETGSEKTQERPRGKAKKRKTLLFTVAVLVVLACAVGVVVFVMQGAGGTLGASSQGAQAADGAASLANDEKDGSTVTLPQGAGSTPGASPQGAQTADGAASLANDKKGDSIAAPSDSTQESYSVAPKSNLDASYDLQPQDVASSIFFFVGTITDVKAVQEFAPTASGAPMFSEGFITVRVEQIYQGSIHEAGDTVVLYCAKANETDAHLGPMIAAGQSDAFFAFAVDEVTRIRWAKGNAQYAQDFSRCTLALESTTGSVFPIREGLVCAPKGTDETLAPSTALEADEEAVFTKGLRADGGSFASRTYYTIEDFADIAAFSATALKTKADEYLAAQG